MMTETPTKQRGEGEPRSSAAVYRTLDAWRGLASLWVVLFHAAAPLSAQNHFGASLLYALPLNGYLGVWIFFVISGYCIANAAAQALRREHGLRLYAVARFRRIYWPMWFSLIFYAASSVLAAFLVAHGYLKSSVLSEKGVLGEGLLFYVSNLTLTQVLLHQGYISDVCWTLCYEVAFYFLVGLFLAYAIKKSNEQVMLNGLHIVTLLSLLALIAAPTHAIYPFDYWPQFGLGVLVYDLIRHPAQASTKVVFAAAALLALAFAFLHRSGIGYHGVGGRTPFLLGLAFAVMLLALHRFDERLSRWIAFRWLGWVGLFSYSLYLTHVLVIGLVFHVLEKAHLTAHSPIFAIGASAAASILLARLFFQFFERPFIKSRAKASAAPVSSGPELAAPAKADAPW